MKRLHFWRPVVRFTLEATTPGVERVVDDHAMLQHFVVVGEDMAEAERDREQAGRLRREIEARGIGASDDVGELLERWFGEVILLEKGVEAAFPADMGELN